MTKRSIPIINHFNAIVEVVSLKSQPALADELAEFLVKEMKLTVVERMKHLYRPSGKTVVYLLSQSHLAIHTWPENNLIHLDLVICVQQTLDNFERSIKKYFSNRQVQLIEVKENTLDFLAEK